jgi:hypothetical protein
MLCQEFEAVLEQTNDQALPAEAAMHLEQCGNCRALTSDIEAIVAAARELAEPVEEPPARVWLQLRTQLESEGIIRAQETEDAEVQVERGKVSSIWAWMRRPALVATYAAFMVLAAGLAWQTLTPDNETPPPISTAMTSNLNRLEALTVSDLKTLDPESSAALRRDLDIVNNFIAVCEKAVRAEPQNEDAKQYLYGAYQQKSELLAAAMEHGRTGE